MVDFFYKVNDIKHERICLLGIPFDDHSSFLKGAAKAPEIIRDAYHSGSVNTSTENIRDLSSESIWIDLGNINVTDYHNDIEQAISKILELQIKPLTLGGDHSITYPIIKTFSGKYENLTILQLDAHCDLYDEFDNNKYSHACPFARIMEQKLVKRLVQVGIRTMTPHQKEQAEKFGVEVYEMSSIHNNLDLNLEEPLYLSLDMDVLDPAFAPGISHYEPGGMSTRDVLKILKNIPVPLVGADIVEYNPTRDINDMTALVAAKFLKEILDHMIENNS